MSGEGAGDGALGGGGQTGANGNGDPCVGALKAEGDLGGVLGGDTVTRRSGPGFALLESDQFKGPNDGRNRLLATFT